MSRQEPISVLLTTEGTYPFYTGGVSTWCHRLTDNLPNIDFTVLAVVTNPSTKSKYDLASNVRHVIKVPQWGLLQPAEYSCHQPASVVLRNLWNTTSEVITTCFKPIFEQFLALLFSSNCDKEELGHVLLKLHSYFQWYDYPKTMNSGDAWNVLRHAACAAWECRPPATEHPTLAELVVPVCAYNSRWETHLGVAPSRIKVIFNGVDPEKFYPSKQESSGRPRVSSVGLIYPLKGQLDLIDAAALLKPTFDNLEMRFYGTPADSEYFDSCLGKVAQFELDGCVTFAGSTKEPWKVYNDADVMAFPSISEAFPYAVLEAMS